MTPDVTLSVRLFANHPSATPVAKNPKLPFAMSNANGNISDNPLLLHQLFPYSQRAGLKQL
jgi:hypothetical protein